MTARGLLLDTHVVLWWLADDATLSTELKETIDQEVDVFVSAATVWEVAIKQRVGKLRGHRDPFDRVLVAQARSDGLALVTRDSVLPQYDVAVLEA